MPNDSQEFKKIINLSREPVKDFRKLLSKLVKVGDKEIQVRDLDDLHRDLKGKFKFVPFQIRKLSWFPEPDLQIAKDNMGTTCVGNKIYTIGGRTSLGDDSLLQPEDSLVQMYDLNTKQWATKKRMLYPHTGNAAVAASNGKIYSFGGYLKLPKSISSEDYALYNIIFSTQAISSLVQEYNPATDTWLRKENLPAGRVFSTAVAAGNGSVYVFGGYEIVRVWPDPNNHSTSSQEIINAYKTFKYSVGDDQWSHVADMPTPRSSPAAVLGKDGKIYVMGGLGNNCQWLPTVEAYDPQTDSWEQKADMLFPRGAFAAVTDSSGNIYAIGGVSCQDSIGSVEIYNPTMDSWQTGPELAPDRLSHGAIIAEDDTIFVIGGSQQHPANGIAVLLSSNKSWDVS
ncbi:MAG: hypothetical protein GY756_14010 [bacterium]|nr:hypothetical protein [bacterium]